MKAQRNTLFPILIWIALFSFCVSAQGVNDTNRLTVTKEGGSSVTITLNKSYTEFYKSSMHFVQIKYYFLTFFSI